MLSRACIPYFLISAAALGLAGCATTVSDTYTYRPADHDGSAWAISGRAEGGAFQDQVAILVNGTEVAGGTLTEFKRADNFTGTYRGHAILAECRVTDPPAGKLTPGHECDVFVDNERAATLDF